NTAPDYRVSTVGRESGFRARSGAMASCTVAAGVALAALSGPVAGHRMQLVRAGDGVPIGGAEVFDLPYGPDRKIRVTPALRDDPEREMPKLARRLVADADGFVELEPDRWHTLLARAPVRYRFVESADFGLDPIEKLGLLDDAPLVIEII